MTILSDFTFKDTGITVKIRKVCPMLAADIESTIPKPLPPENEVDYGEPRGKVKEKNLSDPAYTTALAARAQTVFQAWKRALIQRGVTPVAEDWQAQVTEYRNFIQSQTGQPLEESDDLMVYVLRICVGTPEDQDDLINAVTRRSQPTQEAIDQAKESFQRPV